MALFNELKVGADAPLFKVNDFKGEIIDLQSFRGRKVVLYFYPKDMTPGCTAQACNLQENLEVLTKSNFVVIGVSADEVSRHERFAAKYNLEFTLISDTDHILINQYGVWGLKKFMGKEYDGIHRTTFIIDEKGSIEHIIEKPNTKNQTQQILDLYK